MVIVRLDRVKQVTKTKTGKDIARIEVTELSLNKKYNVTVWLNSPNDWVFQQGDALEMDIRESGEYRGIKQYSANFNSITPVANDNLPPENPTPENDEQKMWADKERRERLGRCIMYALDSIRLSNMDFHSIHETEEAVMESAKRYLRFIYE